VRHEVSRKPSGQNVLMARQAVNGSLRLGNQCATSSFWSDLNDVLTSRGTVHRAQEDYFPTTFTRHNRLIGRGRSRLPGTVRSLSTDRTQRCSALNRRRGNPKYCVFVFTSRTASVV
jgi:hypothetical protein